MVLSLDAATCTIIVASAVISTAAVSCHAVLQKCSIQSPI
jgi:hypothetical protein